MGNERIRTSSIIISLIGIIVIFFVRLVSTIDDHDDNVDKSSDRFLPVIDHDISATTSTANNQPQSRIAGNFLSNVEKTTIDDNRSSQSRETTGNGTSVVASPSPSPPPSPISPPLSTGSATSGERGKNETNDHDDDDGANRGILTTQSPKNAIAQSPSPSSTPTELPSLNFDPYIQTHAYRSDASLSFDDRGMWMLYDAMNWLLDKLQKDPFPHYLLSDEDLENWYNIVLALKRNYAQWLKYEEGFIIVAAVCVLLVAIFTLCYLVYACCRCCCPQSTDEKADKKRDSCKRHCANTVLGTLTILMTFAVACSFLTNHYVHVAVEALPNNLRTSVDDVALYRDDTDQRIQKLLVQDFRLVNSTIYSALDASSHVIIERVKQVSGAISLDHLATIADRATALSDNLTHLEDSLLSIRQDALKLRANLTRLRDWSSGELKACLQNAFDAATQQRQNCETALDILDSYKDLPEMLDQESSFAPIKDQLRRLAAYNLSTLLHEPRSQFETLKLRFHEKLLADKQAVAQRTGEIANDLIAVATNISRRLQRIDVSYAKSVLDDYESALEPYERYRWIGAHVISAILGVMVICFGLGLFFGVCGRRPRRA